MGAFGSVLYYVVLIFFVLLIGLLVLDWIQVLARDWRPRGIILIISEAIYSATDPPLKALRRVVPPLRLGQIQLDLAFMILFFVTFLLMGLLGQR